MKLLTTAQLREADAYTIANEPVDSIDLMERAASACAGWIARNFSGHHRFAIFCGTGNNGGDGLAIARMLDEKGNRVEVFIVRYSDKASAGFLENEKRLKDHRDIIVHEVQDKFSFSSINHQPSTIIIDCIFGSGLNKAVGGPAADVIHHINLTGRPVIAIDIPSGLFGEDNSENDRKNIVRANYTLTFQQPKLAFLFPSNAEFVGEFIVIDIGLDEKFLAGQSTRYFFVGMENARSIYRPRKKFAHKGDNGNVLLAVGGYGKMGAAVMSARACLRAGAGLLTVFIPKCGYEIMQASLPEAMVVTSEEENMIAGKISGNKYDAIGVGPGIGKEEETKNALKRLIQDSPVPLVLDADALNILSENKTWLGFLPASSILTPHPKEFERLAGKWSNDEERLKMQVEFAVKHGVYVVLKGAHTSISCPDGEVYFNSTGNPGMAKGGSGDVLTGIITALFAQGYDAKQSAVLGVFIHGLAGDIAASKFSQEAMLAGDMIECLGSAFSELFRALKTL
ncbi:MAG TPA: NAD(P)H-hydrate dehydratase [Bacteroidia bacterium]|jgi:NAD(P)H-hydrate epimerase